MSSLDTEFHRRLQRKLAESESRHLEQMRAGGLDFEQYKQKSGYLQAIAHVGEWCKEIEANINEGK